MRLKMDNEVAREKYRVRCRYYLPASEGCGKRSGYSGMWHVSVRCNGDCERMRRFDERLKFEKHEKRRC